MLALEASGNNILSERDVVVVEDLDGVPSSLVG